MLLQLRVVAFEKVSHESASGPGSGRHSAIADSCYIILVMGPTRKKNVNSLIVVSNFKKQRMPQNCEKFLLAENLNCEHKIHLFSSFPLGYTGE